MTQPPNPWDVMEAVVAFCGQGRAEKGVLWVTSGGPWAVVADVDPSQLRGRVCTESEVRALVQRVGRPA